MTWRVGGRKRVDACGRVGGMVKQNRGSVILYLIGTAWGTHGGGDGGPDGV